MKMQIASSLLGLALLGAAEIAPAENNAVQWSTSQGGDGIYYEAFTMSGGNTWPDAVAQAGAQTLVVDGTTYTGNLAPVTSSAEASFLQADVIEPTYGDWAILWTGDYVNNGTLYAEASGAMANTSWINWGEYSPYTPSETIGQSGNYGVAMTGDGYGGATDWELRNPTDTGIGGYVVAFNTTAVPEPSTMVLAALGGACLLLYRRRR